MTIVEQHFFQSLEHAPKARHAALLVEDGLAPLHQRLARPGWLSGSAGLGRIGQAMTLRS